jgi:hypothetical protein
MCARANRKVLLIETKSFLLWLITPFFSMFGIQIFFFGFLILILS